MTTEADKTNEGRKQAPVGKRGADKKGDPCEFINPPNLLLAKVSHNPSLKHVRNLTESKFKPDKARLQKMTTLISENEEKCTAALNKKIKQIEPVYRDLQDGTLPDRASFVEECKDIHGAAKALDHIPVIRITASLLRYLRANISDGARDPAVFSAHLDALFNRNALDVKLDAPTKLVLTALETLVDHAVTAKA
ncbi:hypothetical protein QMT40_001717 [Parvibaculaceae bacterium PLY_AMNH_Bact1]|nr:hypothetical protein QMT40_001717 [Parvibaculaceae bacterium PLY_AMNH_Bact1]